MPSIWFHYNSKSACPWHRALQPARFCQPHFAESGWEFLCGEGFPGGHAVYVLNGLPTPDALYELAKLKRKGARVVWSVDDDWLSIPEWNPANPGELGMAAYELIRNFTDLVLTSTPALANTFADMGDRVLCAPNLLDLSRFPAPKTRTENGVRYLTLEDKVKLPVRVVWAGGPTHSGDLEVLTDVLDKLLSKIPPSEMIVAYFGSTPHGRLVTKHMNRGLFHQEMVLFAAYQQVLNSMDPHVYLCPLSPVPFNESKSNLRIMESWALCAAPVATAWGEYNCVKNGHDGRLVHAPDEWESAVTRMVRDHEYRRDCAAHGRIRCEQQYDWNNPDCVKPWLRVFERLTGVTL